LIVIWDEEEEEREEEKVKRGAAGAAVECWEWEAKMASISFSSWIDRLFLSPTMG
jgi:hypothetical protein